MSRRDDYNRYDDRDRDYRPRPRRDDYEEVDIDIRRERSRGPERRAETVVLDRRDDRRDDRRERVPDFLREDYGRPTETQQLVIRDDRREDDGYSRVSRRRSNETLARSRGPERVKEEEIIIREKEGGRARSARPPYPSSDIGRGDREVVREEVIYRDSPRPAPSRAPPPGRGSREEIDISIKRRDDDDGRSSLPPRRDAREIEIREERARDDRRPPTVVRRDEEIDIDIRERIRSPPRSVARGRDEREEIDIDIRERRRSPPRSAVRGREDREEIDIRIRESDRLDAPAPRPRSRSRGQVVARKEEEWVVRRPRREPSPPRDYEKEQIIIRRRERTPSPEPPPREPTPEPVVEPIVRPPIVQEVITHYRNIDHGFERARSPSPPPIEPSRDREEDLEIAIRRSGVRNGKPYDDELIIERDQLERDEGRLAAPPVRRRSPSRTAYEREIAVRETDYSSRRPAAARNEDKVEETRIDLRRTTIDDRPPRQEERPRTKDRMWTEVTKDLVIKEAIEESGYDYEETDQFYYVMEYLRYEDVVRLVELTDDIRRQRRERIREIQFEREEIERAPKMIAAPPPPPPVGAFDERIYEREYVYDREGRRYR